MSSRRPDGRDGVAIAAQVAVAGAFALAVFGPAWAVARAWSDEARARADDGWRTFVHSVVLAFAFVVLIGLVLGAAQRMTIGWYLATQLTVAAAVTLTCLSMWRADPARAMWRADTTRAVWRADRTHGGRTMSPPPIAAGFWIAIVAFVIGMGLSNSPYTAYDAVSYHLFFPARWLQAHRLTIIPTPFSDEAQAYQPGNGELWFLWLMLPFHSDLLARVGQVPFYLLGAAATYLIAVRCGASRVHAAYAPTLFLVASPIVEQAAGANVDLIAAALFVTAVWLALEATDSDRRRDWALWGCAIGLFVGTKYLAVVYTPVLVLVAILRKPRFRMLWGIPGILALGAPWYLRNWIVAGSPLYPATLTIAGATVGRGAYTHAAMLQSFMHTTELQLLLVSLVHAFGTPYFISCAPVAVLATALTVVRRRWWPAAAVLVAIAGVIALCWMTVGDNTDARFLLPAVALSPALVPLAFGSGRGLNAGLHVWLGAAIVWMLVGIDRQIELPLPWFMADWLPLHGLLDPRYILPFAALVAVSIALCVVLSRSRALPAVAAAAVAVIWTAAAAGVLAAGAERWCMAGRCEYVQMTSPHIRSTYLYGVRWLDEHVHDVNVAYAGINLPYSLSGSRLSNAVYYVNIDNHRSWRFDQYATAYRNGESAASASGTPPLARPSGVLMPAKDSDAPRPRFERRAGDRDEWEMNLKRQQIGYLFVMTLDPYELDYNWHTAEGFPIEDEWARSDPQAFRLVYSNEDVRIYEVKLM